MNIYIDYTAVIDMVNKAGKYNGAGHFARELISVLLNQEAEIKVIVYNDFVPEIKKEKELLSDESLIVRTGSITDVDLSGCDVLFFPVAYGYNLSTIVKIRKKNKDLRIYAVIHDRQHNVTRFDPMDRYFRDGILRSLFVSFAAYIIKKAAYDLLYPEFIRSVDKAFTVSNYSIQVLNHKNLKRITYVYQPISIMNQDYPVRLKENVISGEYILFVSGGRWEKNLCRALLAFRDFYEQTGTDCKLCITGIDRERLYYIAGCLKIEREFIDEHTRPYDYVDAEELSYLYRNCRYLLYVSKGEGFGLPVLEAVQYGKTVLCSWQSSIPEVAGSILYYVNAYDIASIVKGMIYLNDDKNLKYREELVKIKNKIIDEQIELDKYVLLNEILE